VEELLGDDLLDSKGIGNDMSPPMAIYRLPDVTLESKAGGLSPFLLDKNIEVLFTIELLACRKLSCKGFKM
jgi:hypothetical protein